MRQGTVFDGIIRVGADAKSRRVVAPAMWEHQPPAPAEPSDIQKSIAEQLVVAMRTLNAIPDIKKNIKKRHKAAKHFSKLLTHFKGVHR